MHKSLAALYLLQIFLCICLLNRDDIMKKRIEDLTSIDFVTLLLDMAYLVEVSKKEKKDYHSKCYFYPSLSLLVAKNISIVLHMRAKAKTVSPISIYQP